VRKSKTQRRAGVKQEKEKNEQKPSKSKKILRPNLLQRERETDICASLHQPVDGLTIGEKEGSKDTNGTKW